MLEVSQEIIWGTQQETNKITRRNIGWLLIRKIGNSKFKNNYKPPFYLLVCFIDGKRTTILIKTGNYREANRLMNNLRLEPKEEILIKNLSIGLSNFRNKHVSYLEPIKLNTS